MGKKIIAVVAGVFAAMFVIMIVKIVGQELVVAQRNGTITTAMLAVNVLAWFLGALAGSMLAQRIDQSRKPVPALLVGLILLALAIYDMSTGTFPMWSRVLGVFVFLPGTVGGILLGKRGMHGKRRRRMA